jgi:hypothetical protein
MGTGAVVGVIRRGSPEEIWDESSMHTKYPSWTVRVANRLGFKELADKARAEADDERWWNNRHDRCPNNPRNGAEYKPPTWWGGLEVVEDRRGPGWQSLEGYREQQAAEREVDPLTPETQGLVDQRLAQTNEEFWDSVRDRSEVTNPVIERDQLGGWARDGYLDLDELEETVTEDLAEALATATPMQYLVDDQLEVALDNGLEREEGLQVSEVDDPAPVDESDGSPLGATTVTPELELDDAELVAEPEPTGPELALDTSEVALEVTDPELAADEQQLDEPADEVELAEPELDADILQGGAEVVAEQELPELTVAEPELTVVEPGVTVSEPGLDTVSYEQGPAPTSWWGSKTQQVRGWTGDKYQLTKDWIKELRSGRHKQCHGTWEEPGTWGGAKECTIQVAKNTFGMSLDDVKDTYGHNFVNEILYRNDVRNQSFDEIAKFIDRTQLQGRSTELERE